MRSGPGFLEAFSRRHDGRLVTVEQIPKAGQDPRVEMRELPLQSVFADPLERTAQLQSAAPQATISHTVNHPPRLILERKGIAATTPRR